jgi:exodeoxyribonuclease VII large subunit
MMRRNRFADLHRRLVACPARLIENARHRFRSIEGMLRVLGPDATLQRGYSITMNERGKIIRTVTAVHKDENLHPLERRRIRFRGIAVIRAWLAP